MTIQIKRGTKAKIETEAAKGALSIGEPLLITDENRLAVATGSSSYTSFAKLSEAGGGLVTSVAGRTGDIVLTKSDVGLNNVDNTADSAKVVASAAKLTTSRTINGTSFDGTANITITDSSKEPSIAAGSISQYWRGDKSFQDFFTSVRAATLTGLSTATNAVITAADTVLSALGKLQAQVTGHTGASSGAHAASAIQAAADPLWPTDDKAMPAGTVQGRLEYATYRANAAMADLLQHTTLGATSHPATKIQNVPAGSIAATNVQAAINELDSEKYPKTGGLISGSVTLGAAGGEGGQLDIRNPDNTTVGLVVDVASADTGRIFQTANNSQLQLGQLVGSGGVVQFYTATSKRLEITATGSVLATSGALGYGVGAGGTVTQATSKSTTVTLNKPSGAITMNNASLAAGASVTFLLTCSYASATSNATTTVSVINGSVVSGLNYRAEAVSSTGGGVFIRLTNVSAGALAEAVQIHFNTHAGSLT